MTLNTSQVSYYITQRKKGITQHISAMKAGISVRSGRRIEKGQRAKNSVRHWSTRKDPLEAVWDSMLVPLLKERPVLTPTTLLEMLQDKYPGQYRIDNPTPYYVTVIGIGGSEKQAREGEFDAVMLAPKSTQMVKSGTYNTPYLSYINDYGGRPVLQFSCGGSRCTAVKK